MIDSFIYNSRNYISFIASPSLTRATEIYNSRNYISFIAFIDHDVTGYYLQ